jgi:cytidylate kinase
MDMTDITGVRLITVTREFGAGGSDLAAAVAKRLDWPVLDHDIVHRVAERLRLDDGTVEQFDEHPPSLLARIATVLVVPQPDCYSFAPSDLPSHDAIAAATRTVIEEMAASPPLVIVGHGAQFILGKRRDAMHVRVVAPVGTRLARVTRRMNVDGSTAFAMLRQADQDRRAYLQRYFHHDWRDEHAYDMQINTGRVSIHQAAALIASIVQDRALIEGEPASQPTLVR